MSAISILMQAGCIPGDILEEARRRQQRLGGTLEGHLLRLRAVTEDDVCEALRVHHHCDTIALSALAIPVSVLQYIPRVVAEVHCVLPIAFDEVVGCLTVACLDPGNQELADTLKTASGINDIRLLAAVEPVLRCRIIEVYRGIPVTDIEPGPPATETGEQNGTIVLLGPVNQAAEALAGVIASENRCVVLVDSVDEAAAEFEAGRPEAVIVHDMSREDYGILRDRLRKIAPACPVRLVSGVTDLVAGMSPTDDIVDLLTADLRLCISLFCTDEELASGAVARYSDTVAEICRRLGLPPRDRLMIVNAAYLEDLARLYLGEDESPDWIQADSEGEHASPWPPELVAILACKNRDVADIYPDRLPLSVLGGNILRIASVFSGAIPGEGTILPETYERIKNDIWSIREKEYLPEVADAFLDILREHLAPEPASLSDTQVLVLSEDRLYTASLIRALESRDFSATAAYTVADFADLYGRLWPQFLVIQNSGHASEIRRLVQNLISRGVAVDTIPALLIVNASAIRDLPDLLDGIIEEMLPVEAGPELVAVRLTRLRSRRESEYSSRLSMMQDMGTHGTLADMNLIDLLQALGHTQRTVRISITACGEQLTMFLDDGRLISAECGDATGAEAVYCGLAWTQGIWSVDPITPEELPLANNQLSVDALLIEGCHCLDEGRRIHTEDSRETPDDFTAAELEHTIHDT